MPGGVSAIATSPAKVFAAGVLGSLALALSCVQAQAQESPPDQSSVPWDEIGRQARDYLHRESPPDVWPFERASRDVLRSKANKVFAHFFVPFPLSYDNKPASDDYYASYLDAEKSDQVMAKWGFYKPGSGGYVRERPLPAGPWSSPYWRQINDAIEILRAREIGLDGFACDILTTQPGDVQYDRVAMLMDTAAHVAPGFSIVPMADAAAGFKKLTPEQAAATLSTLARSPSACRLDDGRVLISAFNAQVHPADYWRSVLKGMQGEGIQAAFLPVFLGFQSLGKNAEEFSSVAYGMSDWGFRDPTWAQGLSRARETVAPFTSVWMMPVAPQDARPKDLVSWEPRNTEVFRYLWGTAIATGSPYVQLITWNDYSESTEIAPSSGIQFLFYDLAAYYTNWYKTGIPPRILKDAIYYCHRTQIFPLPDGPDTTKQRAPFKPAGGTPFGNEVEMVALLTAPARLEIEQNGSIRTLEAESGLATFRAPLQVGTPVFRIVRNGTAVVETRSSWPVADKAAVENPVYFGGSSTRPFVPLGRPEAANNSP